MTLSEAFVFKAGNGISSTDANTVLEFNGLTPGDTWDASNTDQKCKFYGALLSHLDADNAGVKSVTEGGYSKTFDHAEKSDLLFRLAKESGCQSLIDMYDPTPVVTNASNKW